MIKHFFPIFENLHNSADQGIFLQTQFQQIGNFGRRQSFLFQKIKGTLKINIFLTCRHLPNTSMNNLQTENLEKIFCLIGTGMHFYFPKMGNTVFDLYLQDQ